MTLPDNTITDGHLIAWLCDRPGCERQIIDGDTACRCDNDEGPLWAARKEEG